MFENLAALDMRFVSGLAIKMDEYREDFYKKKNTKK